MLSRPPTILLHTESAAQRARWRETLSPAGCRLVDDAASISAGELDVVVADFPLPSDFAARFERQLTRGEIVVAAVGGSPCVADVSLPADCTPRELKLSCLLLAEIVELRRQRRKADRQCKLLSHLAMSDPLTGLANRRAWENELRRRFEGSDKPAAVALFDLDRFKTVNDRLGLLAGDRVLASAARALNRAANEMAGASSRFVARLGGDEFGVVFRPSSSSEIAAIVDSLRGSLACTLSEDEGFSLTASAGWACEASDAATVLLAADQALRLAKQNGRNRTEPAA